MENVVEEKAIVIVGAGPAGSSLSLFLSKRKVPHLLLDATSFPRNKVCGDGLTVEVLRTMDELGLRDKYDGLRDIIQPSYGFKVVTPKGKEIHYTQEIDAAKFAPYYTSKRTDFDHFLVKNLDLNYCDFRDNSKVISVERDEDITVLKVKDLDKVYTIRCNVVIGADGVRSIVKSSLFPEGLKKDSGHNFAGVKCYFENVEYDKKYNELEFHFFKNILPGYFWIFPLANGDVNVGLVLMASDVMKRKVNLKKEVLDIIERTPSLKSRFKNSKLKTKIEGMSIPVNSQGVDLIGDGYILHGDSGSLAEALTGKGIGVSMEASKILAKYLEQSYKEKDYSVEKLKGYKKELYARHKKNWDFLKWSNRLFRYPMVIESLPLFYKLINGKKKVLADNLRWTDLD